MCRCAFGVGGAEGRAQGELRGLPLFVPSVVKASDLLLLKETSHGSQANGMERAPERITLR
jgi:hypothetical protein